MPTKLTTLREGMVTALSACTIAGGYYYDLNGDGQVICGVYESPPRSGVAVVMLAALDVSSRMGEPLGAYTRTATWTLACWAPATVDKPAERMLAQERLLDDVTRALEIAVRSSTGGLFGSGWYDVQLLEMSEISGLNGEAAGCVTFGARFEFVSRASKVGGV